MSVETQLQWAYLSAFQTWQGNPNQGDVGAIFTSIKTLGFHNPEIVWRGIVRGGNHRVFALSLLQKEGWDTSTSTMLDEVEENCC